MGGKSSKTAPVPAEPEDPVVRKAVTEYRAVQAARSQAESQAFTDALTAQEKKRQIDLANIVRIMQGYRQKIIDSLSAGERTTYLPEFNCYSVDFMRTSHALFATAIDIVFGKNSGILFVPSQALSGAPYVIFL